MIYVECYSDVALVRAVTGVSRREVGHEGGKGEVCNRLRKRNGCTGMVDEDPSSGQPPYVREARLEQDLVEVGIRTLHHDATGNRLIILCPRLEEWILDAARGAGVNVRDHDLPNDARILHRTINLSIGRFERLLEVLKGHSRLEVLRGLLSERV